jgi:hypothetical protein
MQGRCEWSLADLVREHLADANVKTKRTFSDIKRELEWFETE